MKNNKLNKTLANYIESCVSQPSIQMQHLSGTGATYLLEQKLCNYYSKKFAVTFCNATSALLALGTALEIKKGKIISTPFTWGGSISPFLFCGSKIVFGAVESDTLNLEPKQLLAALSSKTKLVLSTDFNGVPANSKVIKDFCDEHSLFYISDSAQSLGAKRNGFPAGFFADATVLSFSPGKSFFGGEGGAVVTDNAELYEKLLWLSQHPSRQKKSFGLSGYNEYSPFNGRLNPLSAILLNELFEEYQTKTVAYQSKCFDVVKQMEKQGLIVVVPEQINSPDSSTFFNPVFRLSENATLSAFKELGVDAVSFEPNCIPFDRTFISQFTKRFAVSSCLKEQKQTIETSQWVKLNIKNQLC